jgi:Holliday junction resolvase RusA-like endonuclease
MLILNIKDIRLIGINERYTRNKYTKNLILTDRYRNQHEYLALEVLKTMRVKGYRQLIGNIGVEIYIETSKDIDAVIKPILDGLQSGGIIKNDSAIISLIVNKVKITPKSLECIKVWVTEVL